ncbi:hypothetical protein [Fimbriiglobus ruber]|uniref:Uncharacterized protein n=1 Tax=Fimbriiglobus ruber TaxID=1908690 RepID=A0A225D249_9BACT|nr:hypothetical protein [Fimbriiglobus ruber]OWK35013.1 hypothetical protein FRUB_09855 [Fimbriiglobus ruber]
MPLPRRFRAPTADGAVLSEPPADRAAELVGRNQQSLDRADVLVGGLSLRNLRTLARDESFAAARDYMKAAGERPGDCPFPSASGSPLVLAGHQPELFHPGVWVKNFALNALARSAGGTAINLVVDNDTMKSTALRFPIFTPRDPSSVRLESIPFDRQDGELPYEERRIADPDLFRTFADRTAHIWRTWPREPLLPRVWAEIVAHPAATIGERFAAVRRRWERAWGCTNLELPVSRLAQTRAFGLFVRHLAGDAGRFRQVYNTAVQSYRVANRIRSRSHPVPDLGPDELPFWSPPGADGRRGRATAGAANDPAGVRPRALTLTLFARLCLGDFFIHGIGGGKYDEVTDAIIRDYFGVDPPAYQVLTATIHLPLPGYPAGPRDVESLERTERDLRWNPHRHLPAAVAERPDVRELLRRRAALSAVEPEDRAARRWRFQNLRAIADELRPLVGLEMAATHDRAARAKEEVRANAVLRRRDFSWLLYPEDALKPFARQFLKPSTEK